MRIFATTAPAFFPREKPSSRNRKPGLHEHHEATPPRSPRSCSCRCRPRHWDRVVVSQAPHAGEPAPEHGQRRQARPVECRQCRLRLRSFLLCRDRGEWFASRSGGLWTPVERSGEPLVPPCRVGRRRRPQGESARHAACQRYKERPRAPLGSPPCPDSPAERHRRPVESQRSRPRDHRPHRRPAQRRSSARTSSATAVQRQRLPKDVYKRLQETLRRGEPLDTVAGRPGRPGDEGVGDGEGRDALHALVPAADGPHGREARLLLQPDRRRRARSRSSPARS